MNRLYFLLFMGVLSLLNCSKDEPIASETLYFPPINSNSWETKSITDLGWNTSVEQL